MEQENFYHAIKVRTDMCIGCTHCMKVCPTEAIRIKQGKAVIAENRCVDCGECFRICPVCAIIIEQDDFDKIFDYPIRVALVPAVFIGQFPEEVSIDEIYSELMEQGFTHVFEVEHGVEILQHEHYNYIREYVGSKPVISPFCPAIVRLIQVKFPALTDHIMLLKPPVDIAAIYNRKKFTDEGYNPEEVGIFYISPCAAKVVAVRSPVGEATSEVSGVINMNYLYNKVFTGIKQARKDNCIVPLRTPLKDNSIVWSLTRGESAHAYGRSLAIDGIHNVIEFLEKLETQENPDIDFLELRACDESCAGGVLTTGNRFLTSERLHNRAEAARKSLKISANKNPILNYHDYIVGQLGLNRVPPRSIMKLDNDMAEAMKKMKKVHDLMLFLPQVDCGSCGCPSCAALAEDIVQERASLAQCNFVQRTLEERKLFSREESREILEETWGKDKFNRKWLLDL
ncbi:MAG: [Fe-Fe] hydrogenase large subunit C-terminal domain-containing protein [Bacteroidota bacterium]|nr:[Fe-Fe] hydrogenase large subunit C-terminal domain-containing protein [Bacteroidota bacterium]